MAKRTKTKSAFAPSASAETQFARQLKKVAQAAAHIVDSHVHEGTIKDTAKLLKELDRYAELIGPWAYRQAAKMQEQVAKKTDAAYKRQSALISKKLREQAGQGQVGYRMRELLAEQVKYIQSIPRELGVKTLRTNAEGLAKAQEIERERAFSGQRATPQKEIIAHLKAQLGLTEREAVNRAKLIARTETARVSATMNQARAEAVGVTHYTWEASMDGATRESHAEMNGKVFAYANPPTLSDGAKGNPGEFYNCRCYASPILPDE